MYALAQPRRRAWDYLVHHGLQAGLAATDGEVTRSCEPQPTTYSWLVTYRGGEERRLLIAVSEAGRTWQLDPVSFEPVRPEEFARGGLLPQPDPR